MASAFSPPRPSSRAARAADHAEAAERDLVRARVVADVARLAGAVGEVPEPARRRRGTCARRRSRPAATTTCPARTGISSLAEHQRRRRRRGSRRSPPPSSGSAGRGLLAGRDLEVLRPARPSPAARPRSRRVRTTRGRSIVLGSTSSTLTIVDGPLTRLGREARAGRARPRGRTGVGIPSIEPGHRLDGAVADQRESRAAGTRTLSSSKRGPNASTSSASSACSVWAPRVGEVDDAVARADLRGPALVPRRAPARRARRRSPPRARARGPGSTSPRPGPGSGGRRS